MSLELANDFFDYYKQKYSIRDYVKDEKLTEEDALLLLCAFDKLLNKEDAKSELGLNAIKSLDCYNDYFNISNKHAEIVNEFLTKIAETDSIKIALERLLDRYLEDKDLSCKSGISYSNEKQALKSDGDIYDENVIVSIAKSSGLQEKDIKKRLSTGLEEYICKKEEYVNNALSHMHSLYACVDLEK